MDAKEYLLKIAQICKEYGENCSDSCPLKKLMCGMPAQEADMVNAIEFVEGYERSMHPYGCCKKCGEEFNSELICEYEIGFCPWCGTPIVD